MVVVGLTVRQTNANLVIVPTFDSTITSDGNAAGIEAAINQAIGTYETRFSDNVTLHITFQSMNSGLGQSQFQFGSISYSSYRSILASKSTTTDDATALAHLPSTSTNPVNGASTINLKIAPLRDFGFTGLPSSDGTIGINTHITDIGSPGTSGQYSFVATAEHEIDEIMGLGSGLDFGANPFPEDLFRYNSSGARTFLTTGDNAYFSIDGTTDLARFNQGNNAGGDYGDWWSNNGGGNPGPVPPTQVQDAFAYPGRHPGLGVELRALDVVGYDLLPATVWTGATNSTWDTSTHNWLTSTGNVYTNGDRVQFDDTNTSGRSSVTIVSGGVTPGHVIFDNSAVAYTINAADSTAVIGGSADLIKNGSGLVTMNIANNSFTGTTSINGGTLAIVADRSLGAAPLSNTANQLTINGGSLQLLNSFTIASTRGIQVGSNLALIGTSPTTGGTIDVASNKVGVYNGAIADVSGQGGILNKAGLGELDLGGSNTFSGSLRVNSGLLKLTTTANNVSSAKTIAVASGATLDVSATNATAGFVLNGANHQTLGGSGTVTGNLTVGSGAILSAGTSAALGTGAANANGKLTNTGNETWNAGGIYEPKFTAGTGTPGTNWDEVQMTGLSVSAAGNTLATAFDLTPVGTLTGISPGTNWIIATTSTQATVNGSARDGSTVATAPNLLAAGANGFALDTSNFSINGHSGYSLSGAFNLELVGGAGGDSLTLTYTGAPEPGTGALVLVGLLPLLNRRRRNNLI